MPNEEKVVLLVSIIVAGFFIAVVYHYVMGQYLDRSWPLSSFLFVPEDRFFDFDLVVRQSAGLDPFGEDIGGFAGAPFAQFVAYLFSLIRPSFLRLSIFFCSFFLVFIPMARHYLCGSKSRLTPYRLLPVFVIAFLTYPVLFAVDRGNFDLLVCALLLLFAFTRERQHHRASAVFLAVAIAVKPYAAIFTVVFLLDRKYRHALLAVSGAVLLSVLSLSLFRDGLLVETHKYVNALSQMAGDVSAGSHQSYTSDLFGFLTAIVRLIGDALNIDKSGTTMYLPAHPASTICYAVMAVAVLLYFMIYLWKKQLPSWKLLAVLTILLILLPYNSGDYRLTYLLVPMLMYMAVKEKTRHSLLTVILWGLLLVPKNYYPLHLAPADYYPYILHQSIGMVVNPLLLIVLLVCIVPDAFSVNGVASTFRLALGRLLSLLPTRQLENPRSS
jgi:hypothetical protein